MEQDPAIQIGDKVVDRLTHQQMQVTDIFSRDGITLYTITDNNGKSLNVIKKWLRRI